MNYNQKWPQSPPITIIPSLSAVLPFRHIERPFSFSHTAFLFQTLTDMPAHFISRFALLIFGLALMAFDVVLSISSNLGTSPISSVPYSFSFILDRSIETLTVLMHILMISLQMILLGKKFQWHQWLQLPDRQPNVDYARLEHSSLCSANSDMPIQLPHDRCGRLPGY